MPRLGADQKSMRAPVGWESPADKAARQQSIRSKCDFKLKAYDCSFSAYLDANPSMKKWAELNPEMAAKERIRLQSVD